MPATLDPKLDVVFKLLFADPRSLRPLLSLLSAVLHPPEPIRLIRIINPEVPKQEVDDRGVTLDLLVELANGSQVNVEMQAWKRPSQRKRALYNWSCRFREALRPGDGYERLQPCVVVFIFAYPELPGGRFHSTFRVLEIHDQTVLCDTLEIHAVELPKLRQPNQLDPEDGVLSDWGRFLAARTDAERREVAMSNPDIDEANRTLERLSLDPAARELARRREDALLLYQMDLGEARKAGIAEGRAEGRVEGRLAGQVALAELLCHSVGVPLDDARRARLREMSETALQEFVAVLAQNRAWPGP